MEEREYKIIWETNYWWGVINIKGKYLKEVKEALNNGFKKYKAKYFEKDLYKDDILNICKKEGD